MYQERLEQQLYVSRLKLGQLFESLMQANNPHALLREQVPAELASYSEIFDVLEPQKGTLEMACERMRFLTDLANHEATRAFLALGLTIPILGFSGPTGRYDFVLADGLRLHGERELFGVGLEESYRKGILRRKYSTVPRDLFNEEWVCVMWRDKEQLDRNNWNHAVLFADRLSCSDQKWLLGKMRKSV